MQVENNDFIQKLDHVPGAKHAHVTLLLQNGFKSKDSSPVLKRAETVCSNKTENPCILHDSDNTMINILCTTVMRASPHE